MREALAAARRRGCSGIEAPVRQDDERLARFYRKLDRPREDRLFTWPCA
jgi:hypothetical protein